MYMYMCVECVFSEIVCSALCFHDFVCMHLLSDQFFNDFLKFQKLMQPYIVPYLYQYRCVGVTLGSLLLTSQQLVPIM